MCVLLGVLAKHTMVLWVPSFALFLLTTPTMRAQMLAAGFWIMTGMGALGGIPILVWNAPDDWVTLKHTQIHAGFEDELSLPWLGPLAFLGTQFALLLGFWFVVWGRAMWRHRPGRKERAELGYLWWMSAPTIFFFGLFSLKTAAASRTGRSRAICPEWCSPRAGCATSGGGARAGGEGWRA